MKITLTSSVKLLFLSIFFSLMACSDTTQGMPTVESKAESLDPYVLDVYKSPTCGCCTKWIEHIEDNGFNVNVHHPDEMHSIKQKYHINPNQQSCHTAVSSQGFVFEGHVPASAMRSFLKDRPEGAIGLTVPGMPIGSPGMEMGDRFDPYEILLVTDNGQSPVYKKVHTASEQ